MILPRIGDNPLPVSRAERRGGVVDPFRHLFYTHTNTQLIAHA